MEPLTSDENENVFKDRARITSAAAKSATCAGHTL
jgi:hypothetical protein